MKGFIYTMKDVLKKMCQDIIIPLETLKERNEISSQELEEQLRIKLQFLKDCKEGKFK